MCRKLYYVLIKSSLTFQSQNQRETQTSIFPCARQAEARQEVANASQILHDYIHLDVQMNPLNRRNTLLHE